MDTKETEDQMTFAYEIPDEALESAAIGNTPGKKSDTNFLLNSLDLSDVAAV